jgi:hypothetical protein
VATHIEVFIPDHVVMGIVQSLIVALLIVNAGVILWRFQTGIARVGAWFLLTLGVYLSWVAGDFFQNELGPSNYEPAIVISRLVVIGGGLHLLIALMLGRDAEYRK